MNPIPLFRRIVAVVVFAVLGPVLPAQPAPSLIVFDASGSMKERIEGGSKIDIAKRAITELVAGLPDDTRIGLVAYGHRKPQDCEDIELLLAPEKLDRAAFARSVAPLRPKGRTPLSAALEFAAEKLGSASQPASVILVTDGLETCGKDPCATAAKLKAAGVSFVVHVVAFDLSSRDARSLACIAHATGGRFLQAKDAASLKDALAVVAAEAAAAPAAPKPPAPAPKPLTPTVPLSLKAPESVAVGESFPVAWTGPDASGDFITVVPMGAPDEDDGALAYTRRGAQLTLIAPDEPGLVEVRYVSGRDHAVLARKETKVLGVEFTLAAVAEATAGSEVKVVWNGPAIDRDAIAIVPLGTSDDLEAQLFPVEMGKPALVIAPMQTGAAEIRYLRGQRGHALARRPIMIVAAKIELFAPDEVVAGSTVEVSWKGASGRNDYVTIVPKSAPDSVRGGFGFTGGASKFPILAPIDAGECEVRYVSGQDGSVLARRPLRTVAGAVALAAPDQAMAGALVSVEWRGPNNEYDFITILPVGSGERGEPAYTSGGTPVAVRVPNEPGAAEVRYVDGSTGRSLAQRPVEIVEARASLVVDSSARAGATVAVSWYGPDGEGDFLTIVPEGAADDVVGVRVWTMGGRDLEIETPAEPGRYEVRYIVLKTGAILSREPLEIER